MEIVPAHFLYLGLVLIGVELVIGVDTGFDLVLIGVSALAGSFVYWISGSLWGGVGTTAVITFSYVFSGRKFLKAKLFSSAHKTNTDRLIENQGLVIKRITPRQPGQIKIDGEIWRAKANSIIEKNEIGVVESIDGVTLTVKKRSKK
jgi:membrane protein implicated in regulation of membrane protease activity